MGKLKVTIAFFMTFFILGIGILSLAQEEPLGEAQDVVSPAIEYKAEGLRDPFESYFEEKKPGRFVSGSLEPEVPLPPLTVQGVIWGGSFPQAIINHKVVKRGDTIEGAEVIEINQDGIILFYGNRQYILSSPAQTPTQGGQDEKY